MLKKKSTNLKEDMDNIIKQSNDDISDILVRFCGFHKIESQAKKTITTSSLDLYNLEIIYLKSIQYVFFLKLMLMNLVKLIK